MIPALGTFKAGGLKSEARLAYTVRFRLTTSVKTPNLLKKKTSLKQAKAEEFSHTRKLTAPRRLSSMDKTQDPRQLYSSSSRTRQTTDTVLAPQLLEHLAVKVHRPGLERQHGALFFQRTWD